MSPYGVISHNHWTEQMMFKNQIKRLIVSREISTLHYCIALKYDRGLGSSDVDTPVEFQVDQAVL